MFPIILLRCLLVAGGVEAGTGTVTAAAAPIPFERHGVMAWNVGPPTAFWWNRTQRMMVFEAARYCHDNGSYWPPAPGTGALRPYSLHSFFRIRDLLTGEVGLPWGCRDLCAVTSSSAPLPLPLSR